MESLSDIERRLLDALLEGEHPVLDTLRVQANTAYVTKRETRSGIHRVTLAVAEDAPSVESMMTIIHDLTVCSADGTQHLGNPAVWIFYGCLAMLGVPTHLLECGIPLSEWTLSYWVVNRLMPDGST